MHLVSTKARFSSIQACHILSRRWREAVSNDPASRHKEVHDTEVSWQCPLSGKLEMGA